MQISHFWSYKTGSKKLKIDKFRFHHLTLYITQVQLWLYLKNKK